MNTVIKFTPVSGGGWTESQHRLCPNLNDDLNSQNSSGSEDSSHESKAKPIWGDNSSSRQNSFNRSGSASNFFCCNLSEDR